MDQYSSIYVIDPVSYLAEVIVCISIKWHKYKYPHCKMCCAIDRQTLYDYIDTVRGSIQSNADG